MRGSQGTSFRPDFNGSLRIEGRGDRLSSHAGVVLLREPDEQLGVTSSLAARLSDPRAPQRVKHRQSELLRSWLYAMAAERTQANAGDIVRYDAVFRMAALDWRGLSMFDGEEGQLASQPTRSRLLASLAAETNLLALEDGLFDSAVRSVRAIRQGENLEAVTLDIDSFPLEVPGYQPG